MIKNYKKEIEKMGYVINLGNGEDFNRVREPFIGKVTGKEKLIDIATSTYDDKEIIEKWLENIYEMLNKLN